MDATRWDLNDTDLRFLVRFFMPETTDVERSVRTLRQDQDTLEGMICDSRLADYMSRDAVKIIKTSPKLFFASMIHRVKRDLQTRSYTFERESHKMMIIFDTQRIIDLLEDRDIHAYLADMLSSFVKIHSHTVTVRLRKGIWRTLHFSDFDVEGLIRYLDVTDEEFRFPIYKRIADLCLFYAGLFLEQPEASSERAPVRKTRATARRPAREYYECGRHYYRAAARHYGAQLAEMEEVLGELSQHFELAVKPLGFLADHYLEPFATKVFEPPRASQ
jgi:hypothetical protein